ncbi:hypothetical protein [Aestuariivirga sp.]|uniref:hypothetical protein n=1 Tax=Aestuariivirga sp. TaxID=2650926 RepID=UPI0035B14F8C
MQSSGPDRQTGRDAWRFRCLVGLCVMLVFGSLLVAARQALLGDPDIWWHIRTGQWMWQHGSWPVADPFSHSFAGQPWIAKEWLSQLLFAAAFGAAGWNGVMLLSVAALALAAGVIYGSVSAQLNPLYAAMATFVALGLACSAFTARPHLLSIVLVVLWTHLLFSASWQGRAPRLWWLLIILTWANLHAAFTLGFVIAGFAFLDAIERGRLARKDILAKWLVFLVLCPVVSMIHPYGWRAIWATWTLAGGNEAVPLISEWQPFNAQVDVVQDFGLLALVLAALLSGLRLGWARALLIVLLLHMFFIHVRFAYLAFPLLPVIVAPEVARQFPRISFATWSTQPRDGVEAGAARAFGAVAGVLLAALAGLGLAQLLVLPTAPPERVAATGAIAFARANGLTGNVFNNYDFGGPLVFNGIPDFIDGRTDQLFLGGFTTRFMSGPDTVEALAEALRTYRIDWTLLPPGDVRNALLARMPGWTKAYADPYAVIYRRSGQ